MERSLIFPNYPAGHLSAPLSHRADNMKKPIIPRVLPGRGHPQNLWKTKRIRKATQTEDIRKWAHKASLAARPGMTPAKLV